MSAPLVSICLPSLNTRPFLEDRMASIMDQSLRDWDLIVCDSYSDDGSWEFFQKFKDDQRVRLHQVAREGIYAGWNECLKRVNGKYVYIATSDDTCSKLFLEKMVNALERNQDVDLAVCDFEFIDSKGAVIDPEPRGTARTFYGKWLNRAHKRSGLLELLVHLCLDISWTTMTAVLFRASLLERTGFFPADCAPLGDQLWAMRASANSDTIFVPDKLATWRWHSSQVSSRHTLKCAEVNYKYTEKVLAEIAGRIPSEWKKDADWQKKLLWGPRTKYLNTFYLDRTHLRSQFPQFVKGLTRAALKEPGYLARRLLSGLSWNSEECVNDRDYLNALIKEWHVPWPPDPVSL